MADQFVTGNLNNDEIWYELFMTGNITIRDSRFNLKGDRLFGGHELLLPPFQCSGKTSLQNFNILFFFGIIVIL